MSREDPKGHIIKTSNYVLIFDDVSFLLSKTKLSLIKRIFNWFKCKNNPSKQHNIKSTIREYRNKSLLTNNKRCD